jgi:hypothetical protein
MGGLLSKPRYTVSRIVCLAGASILHIAGTAAQLPVGGAA